MAAEILPGKTLLECLNTDLVCDAINVAMREIFKQLAYGRSQTAFSEGGLPVGASLDDLGKGLRSQVGTMFGTKAKGARYLELAQGYVTRMALNDKNEIIAFEFLNLGKFTDAVKAGKTPEEAIGWRYGPLWSVGERCQVHRPAHRRGDSLRRQRVPGSRVEREGNNYDCYVRRLRAPR